MKQEEIWLCKDYNGLLELINSKLINKIFCVCGNSAKTLYVYEMLNCLKESGCIDITYFSGYSANPKYEEVEKGLVAFKENTYDTIMAIGGGSAIDVAKCIKLFSNMNSSFNYLEQKIVPSDLRFIVMPTTAGSGSEATHFAVLYYNGIKHSVADLSALPDIVLLDDAVLKTLPLYQKQTCMMDALCHAIESYWSVNSTLESKVYSVEAISIIKKYSKRYLEGEVQTYKAMIMASNLAGKAINITKTTAGHAMAYKLSCIYGISHGHAVALCIKYVWPFMIKNVSECTDPRGEDYIKDMFDELERIISYDVYNDILGLCGFEVPKIMNANELNQLVEAVNVERLKNNPVRLSAEALQGIYSELLKGERYADESREIC